MPEPEPKRIATKRDPAGLSSEYHKAHKQVMLWATILFIWELVGVDLTKAKDAGGYIGPIVTALRSPQAVPWVLLALVVYFLFKCSVEWGQCHLDRRKLLLAKMDFASALIVSGAAIALYIGQTISRVQFADVIQSNAGVISALSYGAAVVLSLFFGTSQFLHYRLTKKRMYYLYPAIVLWMGSVLFLVGAIRFHLGKSLLVVGAVGGVGTIILGRFFVKLWRDRRRSKPQGA